MTPETETTDDSDWTEPPSRRERFFVGVFFLQIAILCFAVALYLLLAPWRGGGAGNVPDFVFGVILAGVGVPILGYVGFRMLMAAFSYLSFARASAARRIRLPRQGQWYFLSVGSMIGLINVLELLIARDPLTIATHSFILVMFLNLIAWCLHEMFTGRNEPPREA